MEQMSEHWGNANNTEYILDLSIRVSMKLLDIRILIWFISHDTKSVFKDLQLTLFSHALFLIYLDQNSLEFIFVNISITLCLKYP